MDAVTSRELKNRTGEILRRVRGGERITVTNRGRPVAIVVPFSDAHLFSSDEVRPYETAWNDIIQTLAETAAEYESWEEAVARTRRR
jgi:prevent-host-death family protein